ncbi:PLP-dependent aminotransferase family protein [Bordetella bronchialis]|uniref:DNA-binding protein n=1 Tax=Bordetella bronchialis TaxID=463025 RepID=A0ABM6CVX7_9BORD|nr:PLP-dependent aminotransferase family protein [Bordetella bronchialis]ANN68264.1 DNA-binding protein [Bordetella bronchialis]
MMPIDLRVAPRRGDTGMPLYRQIYERFRGAIAGGALKPGDRIPSVRALTQELGLARGTVEAAYALLAAEGYIQARGQAGTVVTPDLRLPAAGANHGRAHAADTPPFRPRAATATPRGFEDAPWDEVMPFQMGLPALDAFPRKLWARLGARCIRAMQPGDMTYPVFHGMPRLRAEIAAYLQVSRGIACLPHQVFITTGYRHTLDLIARALLRPDDKVWLEDPGYPPTRELVAFAGLRGVPVPVDADGIDVASGVALAPRARAAVVTPSHQSPLCVTLALPRRLALLDWASRHGAWIVEDDYDGEYRYASRPLPALKSLDHGGRVLYAGTFSKVLFPSIRLAYLVVPEDQVRRFEQVSDTFSGGPPQLTQAIVAAFIAEGHFARHIQRMRRLYRERREIAAAGLAEALGRHACIEPQPGGMHLVLRLRGRRQDVPLAQRMRRAGMAARPLSLWGIADHPGAALLLNFTNIDTPATARRLGTRIRELL